MLKVRLLSYTRNGERLVAATAKKSLTRKPLEAYIDTLPDEDVEKWIVETLRRRHLSPWEHSVYTFSIDGLSRVATHQLVRHRIASYTQLSLRYATAEYSPKLAETLSETGGATLVAAGYKATLRRLKGSRHLFVVEDAEGGVLGRMEILERGGNVEIAAVEGFEDPVSAALARSFLRDAAGSDVEPSAGQVFRVRRHLYARFARWIDYQVPYRLGSRPELLAEFVEQTDRAHILYLRMIVEGIPAEDARYLLPHGVTSSIVVTVNARELLHMLSLRTCTRAQWELRLVAWLMWLLAYRVHPRLFRWAGPRCVYYENAVRKTPISLAEVLGYDPAEALERGRPGELAPRAGLASERCPEGVPSSGVPGCVHAGLSEAIRAARLMGADARVLGRD